MQSKRDPDGARRRHQRIRLRVFLPFATVAVASAALAPGLAAAATTYGPTRMVSVSPSNAPGNWESRSAVVSADGSTVAFRSKATNLVAGDTNGGEYGDDIFVRNRTTGTTRRASVSSSGQQANYYSYLPSISANGEVVAFTSEASNLVSGDTNRAADVFVHSFVTGRTTRVSVGAGGRQAAGWSESSPLAISADGRYVAFWSDAPNLVSGDTNGHSDVFVRDRSTGVTTRVSVGPGGTAGNSDSTSAAMAANGKAVAFESTASNLVANDTNAARDVFLRDLANHVTRRMSVGPGGQQTAAGSYSYDAAVSRDGMRVSFASTAANLVANDTNGETDVFVRDRATATTRLVSSDATGAPGGGTNPVLSPDGRYVLFSSPRGVVVRDLGAGSTTLITVGWDGQPDNASEEDPGGISTGGRVVVFSSNATNLVKNDTYREQEVFLRVRTAG